MHTITYILCFIFYQKLKPLDGLGRNNYSEKVLSITYSTIIFTFLSFSPSLLAFFGFGRSNASLSDKNIEATNTIISLSIGETLLFSIILGCLFFFTVRFGGYVFANKVAFLFVVPGLFINSVVAYLLIFSIH